LDGDRPRQWALLFAEQIVEGSFERSALQQFHYCGIRKRWKVCYKRGGLTDRFTCFFFIVVKGKRAFLSGHRFPDFSDLLFFHGFSQKNKIELQNFFRFLLASFRGSFGWLGAQAGLSR